MKSLFIQTLIKQIKMSHSLWGIYVYVYRKGKNSISQKHSIYEVLAHRIYLSLKCSMDLADLTFTGIEFQIFAPE